MFQDIFTSLRAIAATAVLCAIGYPLTLLAFAILAAPEQRLGSLVYDIAGNTVGSRLVAQSFQHAGYFWPRPSAVDYNAAGAGGSNLSPLNSHVRTRAEAMLQQLEVAPQSPAPAELVTTSGSGLDPHITQAGAILQVPRVARARNVSSEELSEIVDRVANDHAAGAPGDEPLVNVLLLNLELNRAFPLTIPSVDSASSAE